MKKLITTLLLATTVSQISAAQSADVLQIPISGGGNRVEVTTQVTIAVDPNRSALVNSLRQLELPERFANQQESRDYIKHVLDQLRIQDLPGQEGVNRVSLPDPAPMQFNTAQIIKDALDDAKPLGMGQKIQHFDQQVVAVLEASYSLDAERTARMTLNRAFDVVNSTITLTNTPAAHALGLAGLYKNAFELALSQVNNNISIYKSSEIDGATKKVLFLGDYGVRFANIMKPYMNGANITNTNRTVLILKTLGYLAWDLRLDVRGTSPNSQTMMNLMSKIYQLQKRTVQTKRLLSAIEHSQEPDTDDMAFVADKVLNLIEAAPKALETAKTELGIR